MSETRSMEEIRAALEIVSEELVTYESGPEAEDPTRLPLEVLSDALDGLEKLRAACDSRTELRAALTQADQELATLRSSLVTASKERDELRKFRSAVTANTDALIQERDRLREALELAAPHHQGGHSVVGKAIRAALAPSPTEGPRATPDDSERLERHRKLLKELAEPTPPPEKTPTEELRLALQHAKSVLVEHDAAQSCGRDHRISIDYIAKALEAAPPPEKTYRGEPHEALEEIRGDTDDRTLTDRLVEMQGFLRHGAPEKTYTREETKWIEEDRITLLGVLLRARNELDKGPTHHKDGCTCEMWWCRSVRDVLKAIDAALSTPSETAPKETA